MVVHTLSIFSDRRYFVCRIEAMLFPKGASIMEVSLQGKSVCEMTQRNLSFFFIFYVVAIQLCGRCCAELMYSDLLGRCADFTQPICLIVLLLANTAFATQRRVKCFEE